MCYLLLSSLYVLLFCQHCASISKQSLCFLQVPPQPFLWLWNTKDKDMNKTTAEKNDSAGFKQPVNLHRITSRLSNSVMNKHIFQNHIYKPCIHKLETECINKHIHRQTQTHAHTHTHHHSQTHAYNTHTHTHTDPCLWLVLWSHTPAAAAPGWPFPPWRDASLHTPPPAVPPWSASARDQHTQVDRAHTGWHSLPACWLPRPTPLFVGIYLYFPVHTVESFRKERKNPHKTPPPPPRLVLIHPSLHISMSMSMSQKTSLLWDIPGGGVGGGGHGDSS